MKQILLVLLVFAGVSFASAQDVYTSSGKPGYHKKAKKKKGYDPSKLILGGGISAGFSDGYVAAGLSPIVGYGFTENFSAGVGLGYLYSQAPEYVDPYDPNKVSYIKENIIYPNIWARYSIYRNIFISSSVEYDIMSWHQPGYDNYGNFTTLSYNATNICLFLGGGVKFAVAGRAYVYVEALYDVLQGVNSPYPMGFPTTIRGGVAVGL